jgi:hypothetical protein
LTEENKLDTDAVWLIFLVGVAGIYNFVQKSEPKINNFVSFWNALLPSAQNWQIYVFVVIPSVVFVITSFVLITNKIKQKLEAKREIENRVDDLRTMDVEYMKKEEVDNLIRNIKEILPKAKSYRNTQDDVPDLKLKIIKAKERIEEIHQDEIDRIKWEKEHQKWLKEQERKDAERRRRWEIEERKRNKLRELERDETNVFGSYVLNQALNGLTSRTGPFQSYTFAICGLTMKISRNRNI